MVILVMAVGRDEEKTRKKNEEHDFSLLVPSTRILYQCKWLIDRHQAVVLPMNLEAGRRAMHARTHTLTSSKGRDLETHTDPTSGSKPPNRSQVGYNSRA